MIGKYFMPATGMDDANIQLKSLEEIVEWLKEVEGQAEPSPYDVQVWLKDNDYKAVQLQNTSMYMLACTSTGSV